MLVVVTTVSSLVHIYSIGYMSHDPHQPRFFSYLSLFTFAMLMLVTADNLVQLFFRLGRRRSLLLSVDWLLVSSSFRQCRGHQGLHRQSGWRFRFRTREFSPALRSSARSTSIRYFAAAPDPCRQDHGISGRRLGHAHDHLSPAVHGCDGKVGAVLAAYLASRCHGGPNPRISPDTRRHDGDCRGVSGGSNVAAV